MIFLLFLPACLPASLLSSYFFSSSLSLFLSFFLYLLKIQITHNCKFIYISRILLFILHLFICFFLMSLYHFFAIWFFSHLLSTWRTELTNSFCQSLPFSTCFTAQLTNTCRIFVKDYAQDYYLVNSYSLSKEY